MSSGTDDLPIRIERAIGLAEHKPTIERFAELLGMTQRMSEFADRVKAHVRQQMLEYAKEHGEFVIGGVRYYAGYDVPVECVDPGATLFAILDYELARLNGDMRAAAASVAANYLKSDPIKQSATHAVFNDEKWALHFRRLPKDKLKEGVPKREKKLQSKPVSLLPTVVRGATDRGGK